MCLRLVYLISDWARLQWLKQPGWRRQLAEVTFFRAGVVAAVGSLLEILNCEKVGLRHWSKTRLPLMLLMGFGVLAFASLRVSSWFLASR